MCFKNRLMQQSTPRKPGSEMLKRAYPDIDKAIDITRTLSNKTQVFPGDPNVQFEKMATEGMSITKITLCSHSGTHLDAPSHYIPGGDDIGDIPLNLINGEVRVVDLSGIKREISPEDFSIGDEKRILIKTDYSSKTGFDPDYAAISHECAELIVNSNICCIGIDSPSIEPFESDGKIHKVLLSAKVAIIELLDLSLVGEGTYIMNALPMPLVGCDGAPLRALLYRNEVDE